MPSSGSAPKQSLKIHPTPFKPSFLSIPPSPFSPLTPLAHQAPSITYPIRSLPTPGSSAPLPQSPLQWLWQCHQCTRTYSLGVTRRCLEDGHRFCSGTTTVHNWRKALNPRKARRKRHRACASEFDYAGWKGWGRWRRSGRRDSLHDSDEEEWGGSSFSSDAMLVEGKWKEKGKGKSRGLFRGSDGEGTGKPKDCWNMCDYPSECRWGRQFGVHTPLTPIFPTIPIEPPPDNTTFEGILKGENVKDVHTTTKEGKQEKSEKLDFWGALLASATRRRSVPPSSPLSNVPEEVEPEIEMERVEDERDRDGDVIMGSTEPALSSVAASLTSSAPVVLVKDIIKKSRRARARRDSGYYSPVEEVK
ncbi:hypothetical protein P154DRAFT_545630 [Amniculicola lignicola CBS 123094]|uniref:Uncharacterized protein n=1 Tax=Amniculicola lignicola CBS 123094 TaxID=1392246 RepID=A0A6A5WNE5_9PLEO|nr:hypothetical protein P154DRAFT_545630 [Amniculicola lignicola CBS 123094]